VATPNNLNGKSVCGTIHDWLSAANTSTNNESGKENTKANNALFAAMPGLRIER